MEFANVNEAINWIHGESGARRKGEKHALDNMRALLARLGDPQEKMRLLHVAGTNGKGSTCAFLESALRASGMKTGLYTSPYLCRYNERIRVAGRCIPDGDLTRLAARIRAEVEALAREEIFCTTFEIGTAIAFLYFSEERVDAAVIEVGLGGRFDPTNVITPAVSVIAAIGLDHTAILGDTIGQIAFEKAGIIKPDVPVAVYPLEEEALAPVREKCRETGSELLRTADIPLRDLEETARGAAFTCVFPGFGEMCLEIGLVGHHQIHNARLAVAALSLLRGRGWDLPAEAVRRGVAQARWPGRLEWLDGDTLIDGAHNPQGAASLAEYMGRWQTGRRRVLVTGMMKDKQIDRCADLLAPVFDEIVVTRVEYPRAASTAEIRAIYEARGSVCREAQSVPAALSLAREIAGPGGLVVVAGSLYVAGEARILLTGGEEL